ncbi:MAG: hypothetical protein WCD57_01225 [Acidobacteriaceae bacterium]
MFDKQHAGFEVLISANQNRRNPAVFLLVCGNEIFKIRGEVVLLAATQAEFTNRRDIHPKLSFTDKNFGGSFAPVEDRAGSSPLERRIISQGVVDSEQTSYAQFSAPAGHVPSQHLCAAKEDVLEISTSITDPSPRGLVLCVGNPTPLAAPRSEFGLINWGID